MKIFKSKAFYIVLTVIFSLIFAASLAGYFLLPSVDSMRGGFGGMSFDGEMPDMSSFNGSGQGGSSSSSGEMPDMSRFPGEMPEMGSFPGGEMSEMSDFNGGRAPGIFSLKKYCLPAAIISGVLDALSIFMLIRISKKQKNSASELTEEAPEIKTEPQKKKGKRLWIAVLALVLAAALIISLFPSGERPEMGIEAEQQLLTAQAETGSLTRTLYCGGSLSDTDETELSLVSGVRVDEWLVSEGDFVEAGQQLAQVNKNSVLSVISQVNELMNELDEALEDSRSDSIISTVQAPMSGRIKALYAASGDDVLDVIYENGALALLSLDGLMSVEIEADGLTVGTVLTVKTGESEYQGTVLNISDGIATVTVSDEYTQLDEAVSVLDESGKELGTGELAIHSEAKITGIGGTVSSVKVSLDSTVSEGAVLFSLTDTSYEGFYQYLLSCRSQLSQQLNSLFEVYESGGLYAPCSGRVSSVNDGVTEIEDTSASMPQMPSGMGFGGSSSAAPSGDFPSGEGGEGEGGGQVTASVEKIGRVIAVSETAVTVSFTEDSCEIALADLAGALGSVDVSNVKTGDILVLGYDEQGALVSAKLYRQFSGGSSQEQSGGSIPSSFSGFSSAVTVTEDEDEVDYSLEETQLITVVPYDTGSIEISVDELDIAQLYIGKAVTVTFDALSGRSFDAVISDVDPDGTNSGGNTKYTATVLLERTQDMLTGMNASVSAEIKQYDGILLLSAKALQEDSEGQYVYTAYDEKEDILSGKVYVETGVSDGENVEIVSGLASGDTVYYRYADTLVYKMK